MAKRKKIVIDKSQTFLWSMVILVAVVLVVFYLAIVNFAIKQEATEDTQIANPASEYCVAHGFNLTIRTSSDGSQIGYCVFPSGKECEEWSFYRGACNATSQ